MRMRPAGASALGLMLGAVWHAFDAAYRVARWFHIAAPPDSLLHYNMLLVWWRHGDSPRGYTLTPSPYFIDIALQLPIALLAPDFERFAYVLALVYALLIFAALAALLAIVFAASRALAVLVAGVAVVGFYTRAPFSLILHSFIYNHTSEVFASLGLVVLLERLFRPGAPHRWYAALLYAVALAGCVTSSPFFIATYCVPSSIAVASVVGTQHVTWRRLVRFAGLSIVSALAGLVVLAIIGRYVWPVRQDHFAARSFWRTFRTVVATLHAEPGAWHLALAALAGAMASAVLAVIGRVRRWPVPLRFVLAYYPASLIACVLLPLKRGAFYGAYELRYFQLPWLLTAAFYVGVAGWIARAIAGRVRWRPTLPRWSRWSVGVLAVGAGVALVATASGPLTVAAPASTTSASIACFAEAERTAGLQDGLAGVWMARYLNAARLGPAWRSAHVVVEIASYADAAINPHENNLLWFDGAYRGGAARLNFLVTHELNDAALETWRARLGAPDHVITCPSPADLRYTRATFEIWVWDRDEPQRTLAEIVTHDNLRGPFTPVVGAREMSIDRTWGMVTTHDENGEVIRTRPIFVPGGRYRLDLDLSVTHAVASGAPVAEVVVFVDRHRTQRFPVLAGTRHAALEIRVSNTGATSGNMLTIAVAARTPTSVSLSAMKLTPIALAGIAPFEIFH